MLCNFTVYFYSSKKIENFQPSLLNTSIYRLHHSRLIWAINSANCDKCDRINTLWVQNLNDLIHQDMCDKFHMVCTFDLSHWHPSGRRACLIFALQKIGMAFKGFTVSTAENCLSPCSTIVALQKCFIRFFASWLVVVIGEFKVVHQLSQSFMVGNTLV